MAAAAAVRARRRGRTCSVAKVSDGWPWATVIARADVRMGTSSMRERSAPPCVKARCASPWAEATCHAAPEERGEAARRRRAEMRR